MKREKLIWLFLFLLLIPSIAMAETQYANPISFLEIGAGARATALGGAFVGLADDVSAVYWNPAGLAQLSSPAISIMDRLSVLDTNYANAIAAFPLSNLGIMGINVTYYGVGDVLMTDESGKEIGNLTNTETAFTVSYGYGLGQLLVGGNLKYIYKRTDFSNTYSDASGLGFDAGILYKLTESLSIGAILHDNFTITYSSDQHEEIVPMSIRAGCAYRVEFSDENSLSLMLDFDQTREYPLKLHLGSELILFNLIAVRAGLDDLYVENRNSDVGYIDLVKRNIKPTLGAGFSWEVMKGSLLTIDYALSMERIGKRSFFTVGYVF